MNADIIEKVAAATEGADLDAIVAMTPENFAYLTGFVVPSQPVLRWRHAAAIVTRDAKVTLFAVDMESTTVRSLEPDADIRTWQEFEENAMPVLADTLRELGLAGSRIGLELNYLPARDLDALRTALPDVTWEPAGG